MAILELVVGGIAFSDSRSSALRSGTDEPPQDSESVRDSSVIQSIKSIVVFSLKICSRRSEGVDYLELPHFTDIIGHRLLFLLGSRLARGEWRILSSVDKPHWMTRVHGTRIRTAVFK